MNTKFRVNVLGALLATLLLTAGTNDSPVADAAERGDVETVVALLQQGADVNAAQGDGMTALHWAAMNGSAEMVEVLLYAGAAAEATTRLGGYTALHLASRVGHAEAIGALVAQGADVSARTSTGAMPLHLAAGSGDVDALSVLIEAGAEVDGRENVYEQTPLMWATAKNRVPAMTVLLDAGADVNAATKVVDYAQLAELDGPDRQRRERVLQARIEATREARAEREAREAAAPAEAEAATAPEASAEETAETEEAAEEPTEDAPAEGAEEPAEEDEERAAARQALEDARQQAGNEEDAPEEDEDESEQPAEDEDEDEQPGSEPEPLGYADLVGKEGGLTALHFAARDGYFGAAELLIARGADINRPSGDGTSPLLMATINGNYDLAMRFLAEGADPTLESEDGATPLFATLNNRWAPKALFPQPTAFKQQETDYLQLMEAFIEAGADVNHRTKRHIWYTSFNFDLLGVDFMGATPFWRAAYALDVPAMRLLIENGADPNIPTQKPASRRFRRGGDSDDKSGLEPVPAGGPAVYPIHAAAGVGYGEGFAANAHRHVPDAWLPAMRYLVEELGADVNARDHNGYAPLHHAAARGDNTLIEYLVGQGADVTLVSRRGQTTVDMANGPVQRISPFPRTIELLESLGAKNNNNCVGC
jgi:uncharacterized protein